MYFYLKNLIIDFFKEKNAVVALELAFIIPIMLTLIMGILEFSIIFSIRAGMEEVAREIARIKLSTKGSAAHGAGGSVSEDKALTNLLHTRLISIVLKPENTQICSERTTSLKDFAGVTILTPTCITFSPDKTTKPAIPLNMGVAGDYVKISINYRHQYLTPLGAVMQNTTFGTDLTFTATTYFKKES